MSITGHATRCFELVALRKSQEKWLMDSMHAQDQSSGRAVEGGAVQSELESLMRCVTATILLQGLSDVPSCAW